MNMLILGSGLMGPAAAHNALSDPEIERVTLCDRDADQLEIGLARLAHNPNRHKLATAADDLADRSAMVELMAEHDAVVAALPSAAIPLGLTAALDAGTPWIDLSRPASDLVPDLKQAAHAAGLLIIPGCGVEPGLTEIMARYAAEKLDQVHELHIKCGGIPLFPRPPLGYKIVFGGKSLPLSDRAAAMVVDGRLEDVARYSGIESVPVDGVGELEAWHEGFMPWLLELPALQNLRHGTQKTVRWPGYAQKVTWLKELGLLSRQPINVDGVQVAPKQLLDSLLYPAVRLEEDEQDITIFQVEAKGELAGREMIVRVEMVDRYDTVEKITSMARVTAFTGAIVARMVARGDIMATGWQTPEKLITGPTLERLQQDLAGEGIQFTVSEQPIG